MTAINPIVTKTKRTLQYYLVDESLKSHNVCRSFFLNCVQISRYRVTNAFSKAVENPGGSEMRGKSMNSRTRQKSIVDKAHLKLFIENFPKYESHCKRSASQKLYLAPNMSITKMYELYREECVNQNTVALSKHMFGDIFNSDYNIAVK